MLTRRELLARSGMGFGALAFADLLGAPALGDANLDPTAPKPPQFAPKAKRIIHLFMHGGPSHVDTFDPKPSLQKYAGQNLPRENLRTERKTGGAFPCPHRYRQFG